MNASSRADSPTVRLHKRQFAWQILVPVVVLAVLIITAAIFVVTGGPSGNRAWADVSTIWLIAPFLILALVLATVLGSLIYGIAMLLKVTPKYTGKAQYYIATAAAGTRKVADGATKPIVWVRQAGAVIKSIFKL
jgi:uncharacterized membrane protein YhdT